MSIFFQKYRCWKEYSSFVRANSDNAMSFSLYRHLTCATKVIVSNAQLWTKLYSLVAWQVSICSYWLTDELRRVCLINRQRILWSITSMCVLTSGLSYIYTMRLKFSNFINPYFLSWSNMRKFLIRVLKVVFYSISLFMTILALFFRPQVAMRRLRNRANHVPSITSATHVILIRIMSKFALRLISVTLCFGC